MSVGAVTVAGAVFAVDMLKDSIIAVSNVELIMEMRVALGPNLKKQSLCAGS